MSNDPRVERWDDSIAQQEGYKASGIGEDGKFHDHLGTTPEEAVEGWHEESDDDD